ncbi:MAG: cobalamin-binding protein [Acidobacteriota bacterium]
MLAALIGALPACRVETTRLPVEQFREFTDDLGRTVRLPLKIDRVVSLAPNLTENIFAVGAGDRLVGVTTYCDYPKEALSIEKVGDTQTPNAERIIALRPQVVLVSTASQLEAFTKTLADQKIAVFVTNPNSLDGVLKNLEQFGEIFGTLDKANVLVGELRSRADAVEAGNSTQTPVRVFIQISREPLYTIGKNSFLTEIVRRAGGDVVTKDVEKAFPVLSKETALALAPDAIILSDSEDNRGPNDAFRNSPAVKSGRVFRIDPDILSRPGPRLVDAMEEIARDIRK